MTSFLFWSVLLCQVLEHVKGEMKVKAQLHSCQSKLIQFETSIDNRIPKSAMSLFVFLKEEIKEEPLSDEARERTQGLHKRDPGGNCVGTVIMMRMKLLGT